MDEELSAERCLGNGIGSDEICKLQEDGVRALQSPKPSRTLPTSHPATTSKLPVSTSRNSGFRTANGTPKKLRPSSARKAAGTNDTEGGINQTTDDNIKEPPTDRLYKDAMAHNARMYDLRGKWPEGCTFQPDISQSHTPSSKAKNGPDKGNELPVARRLYEEAAARKLKQADRAMQLPEECSFRPTLITQQTSGDSCGDSKGNGTDSSLSDIRTGVPGGRRSVDSTVSSRRPDTPTRLYESARHKNMKMEEMRKKVEEERLAIRNSSRGRQRPSTPTSGRKATGGVPATAHTVDSRSGPVVGSKNQEGEDGRGGQPVHDKLYHDAEVIKSRRAALAQSVAKEEDRRLQREKEASVSGGISSAALKQVQKIEITSKFEDRLRSSDAKMRQRIKASKEAQASRDAQDCTFKPTISARAGSAGPRGRSPGPGSRSSTPVHERLTLEAAEAKKRKDKLRQQQEAAEKQNFTFRPTLVAANKRRAVNKQADYVADSHNPPEGTSGLVVGSGQAGMATPVKSYIPDQQQHRVPVYDRLSEVASEYKKKREAAKERQLAEESSELTFQPQMIRSPLSAKYDSAILVPPCTKDEHGQTSPTTVFDRLQYAALLKRKNEEALSKQAEKEFSFQPQLNRRAKSAPKRRSDEDAAVPIHERLLKAGERRKSVLIEMAKSKEEEELNGCTFAPTLNRESEAIVLHIIREDDEEGSEAASQNSVPMLHKAPPPTRRSTFVSPTRRPSSTFLAFGVGVTDTRLSAWQNASQEGKPGEDVEVAPVASPESPTSSLRKANRTRRGSVFDRLSVPKVTMGPVDSLDSEGAGGNMASSMDEDTFSVDGWSASPGKKPVPIRRTSMLLKPTLASALKDKHEDHESVVRATASLVGLELSDHKPKLNASFAQKVEEEGAIAAAVEEGGRDVDQRGSSGGFTSPSKPRRRESIMQPTASSVLKASPQPKSVDATHPPGKHLSAQAGRLVSPQAKKSDTRKDPFGKVIKRQTKSAETGLQVNIPTLSLPLPPPRDGSTSPTLPPPIPSTSHVLRAPDTPAAIGNGVNDPAGQSVSAMSDNDITAIITATIATATANGETVENLQALVTAAVTAAMKPDITLSLPTPAPALADESSAGSVPRGPARPPVRKNSSLGLLFGIVEDEGASAEPMPEDSEARAEDRPLQEPSDEMMEVYSTLFGGSTTSGVSEDGVVGESEKDVVGEVEEGVMGESEEGVKGESEEGVEGDECMMGESDKDVVGEREEGVVGESEEGEGQGEEGVMGESEEGVVGEREEGVVGEREEGEGQGEEGVMGECEDGVVGESEEGVGQGEEGDEGVMGESEEGVVGESEEGVVGEIGAILNDRDMTTMCIGVTSTVTSGEYVTDKKSRQETAQSAIVLSPESRNESVQPINIPPSMSSAMAAMASLRSALQIESSASLTGEPSVTPVSATEPGMGATVAVEGHTDIKGQVEGTPGGSVCDSGGVGHQVEGGSVALACDDASSSGDDGSISVDGEVEYGKVEGINAANGQDVVRGERSDGNDSDDGNDVDERIVSSKEVWCDTMSNDPTSAANVDKLSPPETGTSPPSYTAVTNIHTPWLPSSDTTIKTQGAATETPIRTDEGLATMLSSCAECRTVTNMHDGSKKLKLCGGCQAVAYCSKECQAIHWKSVHRSHCTGVRGSGGSRSTSHQEGEKITHQTETSGVDSSGGTACSGVDDLVPQEEEVGVESRHENEWKETSSRTMKPSSSESGSSLVAAMATAVGEGGGERPPGNVFAWLQDQELDTSSDEEVLS